MGCHPRFADLISFLAPYNIMSYLPASAYGFSINRPLKFKTFKNFKLPYKEITIPQRPDVATFGMVLDRLNTSRPNQDIPILARGYMLSHAGIDRHIDDNATVTRSIHESLRVNSVL